MREKIFPSGTRSRSRSVDFKWCLFLFSTNGKQVPLASRQSLDTARYFHKLCFALQLWSLSYIKGRLTRSQNEKRGERKRGEEGRELDARLTFLSHLKSSPARFKGSTSGYG
ncbi:hypothetical protein PoB_005469100 [Plakobranchus ocellatus]|uniref:Uncharacterized protein n=1 Tax=Plakobranchus ocellatus TaxID=259542 RepID=A0AAV4CA36_9GAST|nr:hypothetical protein PoB_005469100 [Plakobranchus ocellatus]